MTGVRFPIGETTHTLLLSARLSSLIQWEPKVTTPRVKLARREAHASPQTSAKAKTAYIYTSTSPYILTSRDSFMFHVIAPNTHQLLTSVISCSSLGSTTSSDPRSSGGPPPSSSINTKDTSLLLVLFP